MIAPALALVLSPLSLAGEQWGLIGSEPPPALLIVAAKLFEEGRYAGAADIYDRFAAAGVHNGRFFLNQGNAHFLAGHLSEAILAYCRAERLVPNDPQLQANLADARGRVLDPPATPGCWPEWLPCLSRPLQARLGLACHGLGWLALIAWVWRRRRAAVQLGLACWLLGGLLGGNLARLERRDARQPLAVVAADGVTLRKGNGDSYAAHEIHMIPLRLNRGVEARVLGARPNGWLQIELADGRVGWAPRHQLLLDREPD